MSQSKRYSRGYVSAMNSKQTAIFKSKFHRTSLFWGIFLPVVVLFSIYASLYVSYEILSDEGIPLVLSVPFLLFVTVFITRQFRYLENVVHFGSHYNLSKNKSLNDWAINILAAYPTMQNVSGYRKFHRIHHAYFGGDQDPCKIRFSGIGDQAKGFNEPLAILKNLISDIPKYFISFYKEVGSDLKTIANWALWHALVFILIWVLFGTGFFIFSMSIFLICFFVLLPVVRYVAEISEHDYLSADSEFSCTFNNLSIWDLFIFHPGGDAYHLVHHLYPAIPWWHQEKAHRFLCEHDYNYKIAHHRSLLLQKIAVAEGHHQ